MVSRDDRQAVDQGRSAARIAVAVPCHDAAKFVAETLDSLRRQSVDDWTAVVVDDGSNDDSASIVAEIAQADSRIRLIRSENRGAAAARNTAYAALPQLEYVMFLDADDVLEVNALEVLSGYLVRWPSAGAVHGEWDEIDEFGRALPPSPRMPRYRAARVGRRRLSTDERVTPFEAVFSRAQILASSFTLFRRTALELAGPWDESFGQHYEDTDLLLRVALRTELHYLPVRVGHYRKHAGQSTAHSEIFHSQHRRLLAKWHPSRFADPVEAATVETARRFYDRWIVTPAGLTAGVRSAREGRPGESIRFAGGAFRAFASSFRGRTTPPSAP